MLPSFLIALMMSAGVAAWVYNKVMSRTGGNTQNSIVVTAISAVFAFIITLTILAVIGGVIEN